MNEGWRVDPAAVDAVVTRLAGPVADVVESRAALGAALGSAAAAAGDTQVTSAIDELVTHLEPMLSGISSTLAGARTVASTATGVYVDAGAEIAAQTDRAVPSPDRFSSGLGRMAVTAR